MAESLHDGQASGLQPTAKLAFPCAAAQVGAASCLECEKARISIGTAGGPCDGVGCARGGEQIGGHVVEKRAGAILHCAAGQVAALGRVQDQALLRAGHAHVKQTAFFFQVGWRQPRQTQRKNAVFAAGNEDGAYAKEATFCFHQIASTGNVRHRDVL